MSRYIQVFKEDVLRCIIDVSAIKLVEADEEGNAVVHLESYLKVKTGTPIATVFEAMELASW